MTITLRQPNAQDMDEVLTTLREWQQDEAHVLLHPGDLGWFWRFGGDAAALATRTWRREGHLVAIGLLDEPFWLRIAIAPDLQQDKALARQLASDVSDPDRGVLPMENVWFDVPRGALLRDLLSSSGRPTEAWMPLRRDLTDSVGTPGVRIETVGPGQMAERIAVQRASFDGSSFTEERWHAMTGGPAYADARCLLAYDESGVAVATVTVWSAGSGRPGLLEPMGVHREHRGRGYGPCDQPRGSGYSARDGLVRGDRVHPYVLQGGYCHLRLRRLPATASAVGPASRGHARPGLTSATPTR